MIFNPFWEYQKWYFRRQNQNSKKTQNTLPKPYLYNTETFVGTPKVIFGHFAVLQGGRTWQAFGGGKHGHETFRQACNYNFRDKCVVFASNFNSLNLTQ